MKPTSGLDLLEQAYSLLRRLPAAAWLLYFGGTGPFCLGLLFFWEEMTKSGRAAERVGVEALGLSALLLFMFAMQSLFSLRLRQLLEPGEPLNPGRSLLLQCLVQPTKLVVLPAAALALLPFGPVAAFYQHFAALRAVDSATLAAAFQQARRLSQRSVRQTWLALAIFAMFGLLAWLNVSILLAFLPELSRMFLGIESEFNRVGSNLIMSWTFFRVSVVVTYCLLEPLWRAAQVLRSLEGEAVGTGADLRRALRQIAAGATMLVCLVTPLRAQKPLPPPQLDQAISQTLENPEFTWRAGRPAQPPQIPGWLEALQNGTRSIFRAINQGIRSLLDWLAELSGGRPLPSSQGTAPALGLRTSSYVVIGLCLALILALAIRQWRTQAATIAQAEAIAPAAVELTDETLLPTDRPEDEWSQLANDLLARGETRLALRALYLSHLAHLAQRQWIQVHRGKSNLDYLRELRRRAKGFADVDRGFTENLRLYERSWYGEHPATAEGVSEFVSNLEKAKVHA